LKALEDANPGLFDKSGARPIGDDAHANEDDVGGVDLGHIDSDAADAEDVSSPSFARNRQDVREPLNEMMQTGVVDSIEVDTNFPDVVDSPPRELVVVHHSIPPSSPLSPLSKDVIILRTSPLCALNTLQAFAEIDLPDDISHYLTPLLASCYSNSLPPSADSSPSPTSRHLSLSDNQTNQLDHILYLVKARLLSNLRLLPDSEELMTREQLRQLCQGESERPELADEIVLRFLTYVGGEITLTLLSETRAGVDEDGTEANMYVDLGVGAKASAGPKTITLDHETGSVDDSEVADHTDQADIDPHSPVVHQALESAPTLDPNHTATSNLTSTNTLRRRLQLQSPGVHLPAQVLASLRLRKLVIWTWLWLYRLMLLMCLK